MTTPETELHARRAGSFGSKAAEYAEYRPGYAPAAIDWVLTGETQRVLDLAAGTGKLTRTLLERGLKVAAVEPDDEMLAELRKRFPAAHALSGTAEKIPLTDASADAVLVGQAFHWFDVPRALDEIARVLRPGGVLGVLWNYEDTRVPWVDGFETQVRSKAGRLRTAATPLPDDHPRFEPFEQETFDHSVRRTADSLAAMIGTHSHMLVASEEERAAIIDRMMKYLRAQPETSKGEFDLPLRTLVLKTRRQR